MKDLLVVKHDTYGQGLTLASADLDNLGSLATGAFVMINMDPESSSYGNAVQLADDADHTALPAKFLLAVGSTNGIRKTNILNTKGKCIKTVYAAPVAKVSVLGNEVSGGGTGNSYKLGTLKEGAVAGVTIVDLSKPAGTLSAQRSYSYQLTAADAADADGSTATASITAALVAKINADSLRCVNAAVAYGSATDGIKFTAITAGNAFDFGTEGILASASKVAVTAHKTGVGTPTQVLDMELEANVERGNGNYDYLGTKLYKAVSDVDTTKTYDTFKFNYFEEPESRIIKENEPTQQLTVVVDAGLTAATFDSGANPATAAIGKSRTALDVISMLM